MKHTKDALQQDLVKLGVCEKDILLINADLGNIGMCEGRNPRETILGALQGAVGEEGTIVTVAFTDSYFKWKVNQHPPFSRQTLPTSGGLSRTLFVNPAAVRSSHPVTSFIGIGRDAEAILAGHDERSTSYRPIGEIIERGGKMMLLGCVDRRNGIQAIHYAQEVLGLSLRSPLNRFVGVNYQTEGGPRLYLLKDRGGCSRGFYKFYNEFVLAGILKTGCIGDAKSILVDARQAFDLSMEILRANPRFALCDDPNCFSCRGTWWYNKRDMPKYYLSNMLGLLGKSWGAIRR